MIDVPLDGSIAADWQEGQHLTDQTANPPHPLATEAAHAEADLPNVRPVSSNVAQCDSVALQSLGVAWPEGRLAPHPQASEEAPAGGDKFSDVQPSWNKYS